MRAVVSIQDIEDRCVPEPNTGCWLWILAGDKHGYGRIRVGGKRGPLLLAHRASYEAHRGPIPPGLHILHSCDYPACVNPDHLRPGTQKDNADDRTARGRHHGKSKPETFQRGDQHWSRREPGKVKRGDACTYSVLTEERVREVRTVRLPDSVYAKRWGLNNGSVHAARTGKTWKHVK